MVNFTTDAEKLNMPNPPPAPYTHWGENPDMPIRPRLVTQNALSSPSPALVPLLFDQLGYSHSRAGDCQHNGDHTELYDIWNGVYTAGNNEGHPARHPNSYTALFFDGHARKMGDDPLIVTTRNEPANNKLDILYNMSMWKLPPDTTMPYSCIFSMP